MPAIEAHFVNFWDKCNAKVNQSCASLEDKTKLANDNNSEHARLLFSEKSVKV